MTAQGPTARFIAGRSGSIPDAQEKRPPRPTGTHRGIQTAFPRLRELFFDRTRYFLIGKALAYVVLRRSPPVARTSIKTIKPTYETTFTPLSWEGTHEGDSFEYSQCGDAGCCVP